MRRPGTLPPLLLIALAVALTAFAPAPRAEANFLGVAADPAGDAADPHPGRDITDFALAYDRRDGELLAGIRLRGEPEDAPSLITLFAGSRTASGCNGYPAAGFGSYSDEFGASWLRLDNAAGSGPRGEADKVGFKSDVQEFAATDRRLAGQGLACVLATLTEPGNPAVVYDTAGPIPLVGLPGLSMRFTRQPENFYAGRPRKLKLRIENSGDARTAPVRLKLKGARGMSAKFDRRSLGRLAPGRHRVITLTVTFSKRASTVTDLKITAIAGKLRALQETTAYVEKPDRGGDDDDGGGGGDGSSSSCVQFFPDMSGETGGSLGLVPC